MHDRIGVKKQALKGLRDYARGSMGEELKGLAAEKAGPVEDVEADELAVGDEGPSETVAVEGVDLPAEEGLAGESDVSLDDIPPELLEKLLAALGE